MALINDAMASDKTGAPAKSPSNEQPQQSGAQDAQVGAESDTPTPAEQDGYSRTVLAGMKVLYDQATHASIVQSLKQGEPAEALANTVAVIMTQIDQKSGGKIPEAVILPAAAEILELTAEIATTAKVFQADEATVARAMQLLVINLAKQYGVEPGDIQALMQSIDPEQVQQMVAQQQQYAQGAQKQQAQPNPAPQPEA